MFVKKMKALSLTLAAMMTCSVVSVHAEEVDLSHPDSVLDVQVNKPYLNFSVSGEDDIDIAKMQFALKNSKGDTVATFNGSDRKLKVDDRTLNDLSTVRSYEELAEIDRYIYDNFVIDQFKGKSPTGSFNSVSGRTHYFNDDLCLKYNDKYYYKYVDRNKFEVVDTMTVPAGTIVADIDSRFVDIKDSTTQFHLNPSSSEDLKCDYDKNNVIKAIDHAGERISFHADHGGYGIGTKFVDSYAENCWSYDRETKYVKIRVPFNDAFPGIFNDDLTLDTERFKEIVHFDLRGDSSVNTVTSVYFSGAAITLPIPDEEGCVEFWVSEETLAAKMSYTFSYRLSSGGWGGGGGTTVYAQLPKSIELINQYTFEFPQSGYCLYGLPADDYTLVIDDPVYSINYMVAPGKVTTTNTKSMQKAAFTVVKKPLLGDCNLDGIIDSADIITLAAYVKGLGELDGVGALAADVTEDGVLDTADVIAIAAHVKGTKTIPIKFVSY